jgi:hypothetical protein
MIEDYQRNSLSILLRGRRAIAKPYELSFPYYLEYQNLRERCRTNRKDRIILSWFCVSSWQKREKSFLASNPNEISICAIFLEMKNTSNSQRSWRNKGILTMNIRKCHKISSDIYSISTTFYVHNHQQRKRNNLRLMTDNQIGDGRVKEKHRASSKVLFRPTGSTSS